MGIDEQINALREAVTYCLSFGYADGAYIYSRMLARNFGQRY